MGERGGGYRVGRPIPAPDLIGSYTPVGGPLPRDAYHVPLCALIACLRLRPGSIVANRYER